MKLLTPRFNRSLLIDEELLAIGIDDTWTGMNVYTVHDLQLLIEWFNKTIRYAGDQLTREVKDNKFKQFHAALWIRINYLHPQYILRFADITHPELLKKIV
jgi:hypothetical protein